MEQKPKKKYTALKIILGIAGAGVVGTGIWYFFIRKTDTATLTKDDHAGDQVFKRMGRFYLSSDAGTIRIPSAEFDYLKAADAADSCIKPPSASRIAAGAKEAAPCDYYGYKGYINACGGCSPQKPYISF